MAELGWVAHCCTTATSTAISCQQQLLVYCNSNSGSGKCHLGMINTVCMCRQRRVKYEKEQNCRQKVDERK